jgi:hypothetical protein
MGAAGGGRYHDRGEPRRWREAWRGWIGVRDTEDRDGATGLGPATLPYACMPKHY